MHANKASALVFHYDVITSHPLQKHSPFVVVDWIIIMFHTRSVHDVYNLNIIQLPVFYFIPLQNDSLNYANVKHNNYFVQYLNKLF